METFNTMLASYNTALVALAALGLMVIVQAFLAGALGLGRSEEVPGRPLKGGHTDFTFRVIRTYQNSAENHSVFVASVLLAIAAGVNPVLVNWLAAAHVVIRMVYWAVYYRGMGKPGGGARTIVYVLGLLANLALAIAALWALASQGPGV